MKCPKCDNPLNEWQDVCEKCKHENLEKCICHDKPVRYVKGSYMGTPDFVCSVTGKYTKSYFE